MVSVCIATFNGEKYIAEQIRSILCQLTEGDEVIISDDHSTDQTLNIIRSFKDDRIKIYLNIERPTNRKKYADSHYRVTRNFENALSKCSGDWIFLADQDDIWLPGKVERSLEVLKDADLVMSNCVRFDGQKVDKNNLLWAKSPVDKYRLINIIKMPFHGCCLAFSRKVLNLALPFPNNLIMHDNWIGVLNTFFYKTSFIDTPLLLYRKHESNVSNNLNPYLFKIFYRVIFTFQIFKRYFKSVPTTHV